MQKNTQIAINKSFVYEIYFTFPMSLRNVLRSGIVVYIHQLYDRRRDT